MNDPDRQHQRRVVSILGLAIVSMIVSACSGSNATPVSPSAAAVPPPVMTTPSAWPPTPAATPVQRPSSPARLRITVPRYGAEVHGRTAHISLDLRHASITSATTTDIQPDEGHVHLYVDNVLVSMNYSLEQDLPVSPGLYLVRAEFVAADHAPFSPRVWSNEVTFTVTR